MKIRSKDELFNYLNDELAWRKKDLTSLKSLIEKNDKQAEFMIRLALPYLYAQWEGFVKNAGTAYLNYIEGLGKNIKQVKNNFVALTLKKKFKNLLESTSIYTNFENIVNFFGENEKLSFLEDEINTKSNLNSEVFKDIIQKLGFDYSLYEGKEKTIIEPLIEKRNKIAHGNRERMDLEEFYQIHQEILMMLDNFKTQIENATLQKLYEL